MNPIEKRLLPQLKQWNLIFDGSISQAENIIFCEQTFNTQLLHLDKEAAIAKGFTNVLINGILTWGKLDGRGQAWLMKILELESLQFRNLATDKIVYPSPLYPDQRLTGFIKVTQVSPVANGLQVMSNYRGWADGENLAIEVTNNLSEVKLA